MSADFFDKIGTDPSRQVCNKNISHGMGWRCMSLIIPGEDADPMSEYCTICNRWSITKPGYDVAFGAINDC